jgi:hypothetical protein
MKVSKIIKDYVTEQVRVVYDSRIDKAVEEYEQNYSRPTQEIIERCVASFNRQLKEELSSKGIILTDRHTNEPLKELVAISVYSYGINGKVVNEEISKLNKERDNKIKEILVTLELGGTKEQLDEMLRNL